MNKNKTQTDTVKNQTTTTGSKGGSTSTASPNVPTGEEWDDYAHTEDDL